MLYGGPLGTYLSGLSSNSSATSHPPSTGSSYTSSSYGTSGYLNSGLRRSGSRYRSNGPGGSGLTAAATTSTSGVTGSSPLSTYYTPQLRRRYGTSETDSGKPTSRYTSTHATSPSSSATTAVVSSSRPRPRTPTSPSNATSGASMGSSSSHSGLFHYSRWSPSKSTGGNTTYGATTLGTSSSWNADLNTATSGSVDYKRLFEAEKLATDELRGEVASALKEMKDLQEQIDCARNPRRPSTVEQRKMERRISECEEELKLLEKLRAESEKLRAEHRALVRVVSRLNRDQ